MKNGIITILCICLLLSVGSQAATRQDLYHKFGPRLLEAVVLVIKDEINLLRAQHGLAERTNQQLIDAVNTKLGTVPEYDWTE